MKTSFIKAALFVGLLPLVGLWLVGILIDPYDIYPPMKMTVPSQDKPIYSEFERLAIPWRMRILRPETIVIGSSKTNAYLIKHSFFRAEPFQANFGSANIYEIFRLVQQGAASGAKQFLIGLDLFSFNVYWCNRPNFSEDRISLNRDGSRNWNLDWREYIWLPLTRGALRDSLATLRRPDPRASVRSPVYKSFEAAEKQFLEGVWFPPPVNKFEFEDRNSNTLKTFRSLVEFASDRGLEVTFVINPSHARYFYAMSVAGLWPRFEAWKRNLTEILAKKNFPLYDFSDFAGLNAIEVPRNDGITNMAEYGDSAHFNQPVAKFALDQILSRQAQALSASNIEKHLLLLRQRRLEWERSHPKEARAIREMSDALLNQKKAGTPNCLQPSI